MQLAGGIGGDVGMKFEQAFIDRAEFLDIERGIIDATGRCDRPFLVVGEIPEGLKQVVVAQSAIVERLRAEQFAVERGEFKDGGKFVVLEQTEQGAEAQPQVGVVGPCGLDVEHPAETGDAVVFAIDGVGADEAAILGNEQEQEAVNDAEELAVELRGGELLGLEFLAEFFVVLVGEEAVAEEFEAFLDAIAQVFADAPALFDGLGVVFFQQAFVGVRHAAGQAGAVDQAVERGEVVKALLLEDGLEVKFDVSLAADQRGIAEQAEREAVGNDAPDVVGTIEVFLDERVRRETRASARRHKAKFLTRADDVNRRRIFGLTSAMRNRERLAVHFKGAGIVTRLITEQREERQRPLVPRDGGGEVVFGQAGEAALKNAPQGAGVSEHSGDLIGEIALGFQAKVGGLLPRHVGGDDLVKQLRAEQTAFNSDGGEGRH